MVRAFSFLILALSVIVFFACEEKKGQVSSFKPLSQKEKSKALIQLGEKLFFDTHLSIDNSIACANCHIPALAFTDGDSVSIGVHGRKGKRNSPSLFNVVNQDQFMWDGGVKTLELQALVPLQDTSEMGSMISDLIPKLAAIAYYDSMSMRISGKSFNPEVLTKALGTYQRSLYREQSFYDKWQRGEQEVTENVEAGYELFVNELNCVQCHTPPTFTNNKIVSNGIYSKNSDPGRYRITGDSSDIGKFKVPALRNVEMTAPYMHDGSLESLQEVIEHYKSGGIAHENKSELLVPFDLTEEEEFQLISFLKSLSDESIKNHWQKVFNTK
jgi:cytochrome c peroxidase